MKTLGIVGGLGPESTIDYYRLLLAAFHKRRPDAGNPPVIINSLDVTRMIRLMGAGALAEVAAYLAGAIEQLARAGADIGLISANTPHVVFDEVARRSRIPLISIVEATRDAVSAAGFTRVGLLGTRYTMQGTFYPDVFAKTSIELVVPAGDDVAYVHDKYLNELIPGDFRDETRAGLIDVIGRLKARGCQAIILGGTELPLILKDGTAAGLPLLDTTRIHVDRAVAELLE